MPHIVRFLFAIMICIANMIIYGLKVNIATTIIGMVKRRGSVGDWSDECPEFTEGTEETEAVDMEGPYDWSTTQQGLVVSIYFAGYLIGMFPCGYFADRFNTKNVLLVTVVVNAVLTFIVPFVAGVLWLLYTTRFIMGFISAANLPIVNVMIGKWLVYDEKSTWVAIIYAGTSLGTVVSILTSGMIMHYFGWECVFYIHGVLPLFWCVVYYIFFADCPEQQKYISEEERQLIITSYGHRAPGSEKTKVPWKQIFKSVPFLALIVTNTFGNFCWYFLLLTMPLYMNKILRFNIKSNAMITCSPYLINAFTNSTIGKILDMGRLRGFWSQTGGRKIAVFISAIPTAIMMLVIAYIGCDRTTSTVLLVASIVTSGAIFVGHLCNQNDLAPNYAGILMGITNTPGTISAFLNPTLVGVLMEEGHTIVKWRLVFWINIIAALLGFLTFFIFGSGKIQKWNYPDDMDPQEWEGDRRQQETKT